MKKTSMLSNVMFMINLANKYIKSIFVFIILEAILYVINNVLGIAFTPLVLQMVQSKASIKELLTVVALFSIGIMLCNGLLGYLERNHLFGRIELRTKIIYNLGHKVMCTSYNNLDKKDFNELQNKASEVTSSNSEASEAIWTTIQNLLQYSLGFIIYLTLLIHTNLLIIIFIIATTVAGYFVTLKVDEWRYLHKKEEEEYSNKVHYILRKSMDRKLAKDIRIFGMQNWLGELYEKNMKLYTDFHLKSEKKYFAADLTDILLTIFRNAIAYVWLILMAIDGKIQVAQFVLYFSAISTFTVWITSILTELSTLHKQSLDIQIVRDFLDYKEDFDFKSKSGIPIEEENTIELKNVSFCYPNTDKKILDKLNLVLYPKEKLAIVGLNGAGKTTLIKLLMGFYDPTEGEVLLNGINIKKFNRREYYKLFSAVFQQFSVLATTIEKNVVQNTDTIDEEGIKRCLTLAGLDEKIGELEEGINTKLCKDVFDNAIDLSGGQMQKLMLARAIYKEAPFLILDEPTAALDPIAEHEMYEKYNELTKEKSSIFISHRLASTRFCNRIILLKDGKIIEEGSHDSLLALDKEYAYLFNVQSKYYKEEKDNE